MTRGIDPADASWSAIRTEYALIHYLADHGDVPELFRAEIDRGVTHVAGYLNRVPPAEIKIRLIERLAVSVTRHDIATIVISRRRLPHSTAIVHELTHLIAGIGRQPSALLDEGLAVFLQEKFGGSDDRSFPAEGRDLHQETRRRIAECRRSLPLSGSSYLRTRDFRGAHRRLAYLQAGSFVRFLVEQHGLEPVTAIYAGRISWLDAFGASLEALEVTWLDALSALPAPS